MGKEGLLTGEEVSPLLFCFVDGFHGLVVGSESLVAAENLLLGGNWKFIKRIF